MGISCISDYLIPHLLKNDGVKPRLLVLDPFWPSVLFADQVNYRNLLLFQSNWSSSNIPGVMGGTYEGGHGGATTNTATLLGESTIGANDEPCAICGYALRLQPMCSLPPCAHVFHNAVSSPVFSVLLNLNSEWFWDLNLFILLYLWPLQSGPFAGITLQTVR